MRRDAEMEVENKKSKTKSTPKFETIAHFENLARLRAENPHAFSVLAPSTKIAFGAYLVQKRAAGLAEDKRF